MNFVRSKAVQEYFTKMHGAAEFKSRRTGKTTALAYSTVALAIQNPGKVIKVVDHYPNRICHRDLLQRIRDLVQHNNLAGFNFDVSKNTVKFILDEE